MGGQIDIKDIVRSLIGKATLRSGLRNSSSVGGGGGWGGLITIAYL